MLDPTKQFGPIVVLLLFFPSKLHVIDPAPILVSFPISASPIYDKWDTFTPLFKSDFLISTKFPIFTSDPISTLSLIIFIVGSLRCV